MNYPIQTENSPTWPFFKIQLGEKGSHLLLPPAGMKDALQLT